MKHLEECNYFMGDLGGIEKCLQDVRELVEYPLTHPEIYAHIGVEPPRGILLHGAPGCGALLCLGPNPTEPVGTASSGRGECGIAPQERSRA